VLVRIGLLAGGILFAGLGFASAVSSSAAPPGRFAAAAATGATGLAAALWALRAPALAQRRAGAGAVLTGAAVVMAALFGAGAAVLAAAGPHAAVFAQAVAGAAPVDLLFWAVAGFTVLGAAGTALLHNILHSAFSLLATLLGVAILYVYLSADFVAVTQVLLYVGGVLVLILFAIMLTNQIGEDPKVTNRSVGMPAGLAISTVLAATLVWVAVRGPFPTRAPAFRDTVVPLGDAFLRDYLLPFELASVLLLAALVGAVVIARKELGDEAEAGKGAA